MTTLAEAPATSHIGWRAPSETISHGLARLVRRLYTSYFEHGVSRSAATLSFYFLFSLFPLMFVLVALTEYLPVFSPSMQRILWAANAVVPKSAMSVINEHLTGAGGRHDALTIGILATLYSAARGMDAVRAALNASWGVRETRSFWRTEGLAFAATFGGALLVLVSVGVAVLGGDAGFWLSRHLGVDALYVHAWRWARWPVTVTLTMFLAALGYALLPNVRKPFRLVTPGSIAATAAALVASWGFGEYATHFGRYDVAYGSIGGVIVLMTWFYILGLIYILGGELDAALHPDENAQPKEGRRT
ncbi:MAG TPA: YihY/virulence factor BrkB family protein [Polyangia bacterium]|nr:YihY/virulence factor BrkB family protein [Polyangia bacterium]